MEDKTVHLGIHRNTNYTPNIDEKKNKFWTKNSLFPYGCRLSWQNWNKIIFEGWHVDKVPSSKAYIWPGSTQP